MNTPSITSWNRLEPKQRSSDYNLGLQTRIHDPLWMLARQWQVGEFEGEDAASPVKVDVDASFIHLNRFLSKSSGNTDSYNPETLPLEVAAEKEKVEFSSFDARLLAELGNEFLKFVSANNMDAPDRGILLEKVGFSDSNEWSKYPFVKKSIDAAKLIGLEVNQLSEAFGKNGQRQPFSEPSMTVLGVRSVRNTLFPLLHPDLMKTVGSLHFLLINIPEDTWIGLLLLWSQILTLVPLRTPRIWKTR